MAQIAICCSAKKRTCHNNYAFPLNDEMYLLSIQRYVNFFTFSIPVSLTFDLEFAYQLTYVQRHIFIKFEVLQLSDFE